MDCKETFFPSMIRSRSLQDEGASIALQHCRQLLFWTTECIATWISPILFAAVRAINAIPRLYFYKHYIGMHEILDVPFILYVFRRASDVWKHPEKVPPKAKVFEQNSAWRVWPNHCLIFFLSPLRKDLNSCILFRESMWTPMVCESPFLRVFLKRRPYKPKIHSLQSIDSATTFKVWLLADPLPTSVTMLLCTPPTAPTMIQCYIAYLALKKNEERKW
jgi:hypothetical protein